MAENTKTDELQNTRHLLLDHFANSMPVPVDRHYAEYLLGQVIAEEVHQALSNLPVRNRTPGGEPLDHVRYKDIQVERNKYPLKEKKQ